MADRQSVLDIILDLSLKLVVVFVATTRLKINQEPILVVEGKHFILFGVVDFKLSLEFHRVTSWGKVRGATETEAVAICWAMLLYANTMLL